MKQNMKRKIKKLQSIHKTHITVTRGDCLEVMRKMKGNSIDTIITDPPYGLSFMGKKWDYDVPSVEIFKEMLRVAKPGTTLLCFAGSRTQHKMALHIEESGWILKDCIMWLYGSGFPKATDISKQLDKMAGVERKTMGVGKGGVGSTQSRKKGFDITAPASPQAQHWNGWKSHGLKPAYEPIIVAVKSNEGTYAQNALKHGVAGLNIDGGRIDTREKDQTQGEYKKSDVPIVAQRKKGKGYPQSLGRFPSNIILDEEAAKILDQQSEVSRGGASRFFYCAKASKTERNMGYEEKITTLVRKTKTGKESVSYGSGTANHHNHHPTVKPVKLMEYLCKLTKTPTGGIVLDPFGGSGTTGVACKRTGRDCILIEKDLEYVKIIRARLKQKDKFEETKKS